MANQRRGFRRTAAKRRTSWEGTTFGFTVTTGAAFSATAITEAILEANAPGTIVRVRGRLAFRVSAAGADNAQSIINVGLILVNAPALAAGVASLPTPRTDVGSDWMMYDVMPMGIVDSTLTTGLFPGKNAEQLLEVDVKAMRKYDRNQALAMVIEDTVRSSTQTTEVWGFLRFLLMH